MPDIREDQQPKVWALLFCNNQEQRLAAIDILAKVDVDWPVSWLALLLEDKKPAVSNAAYQALSKRGKSVLPLLSIQRLSPLPKVRQLVIRLVGEYSDLSSVRDVIPSLFDQVVDVREEGRKALETMLSRSLDNASRDPAQSESLGEHMKVFADLAAVSQRSVRAIVVACLMSLSVEQKAKFWQLFPDMDIHAKSAIEHEILTRPNFDRIQLLYNGLTADNPDVPDRAYRIIERLINKDNINNHIETLDRQMSNERTRALEYLSDKGMIGTFFEYFPWVRRDLRIPFLKMFQNDFGERFWNYLETLVEEGNPHLIGALMDNFLTYRRDLPDDILHALLEHPSPLCQRSALNYLYYRGTQPSVGRLMGLINEEDPQTSKLAVRAISRISRDYMVDHFNEMTEGERNQLAAILQRINPNFIENLTNLLGGLDEEDRIHLTQILAGLGKEPAAAEALAELMDDPDEKVRATAVRGFSEGEAEELPDEVIDRLLTDPDPRVRANTLESLPEAAKECRIERIEEMARSEVPRERANAVLAMANLGRSEFEIPLLQMLQHPDSWMRTSGLWVLSRVDAEHLMDKALELCDDSFPHVRIHALRAIGKKGTEDMGRQLTPYLSDPVGDVREEAHAAIKLQTGLDYQA